MLKRLYWQRTCQNKWLHFINSMSCFTFYLTCALIKGTVLFKTVSDFMNFNQGKFINGDLIKFLD